MKARVKTLGVYEPFFKTGKTYRILYGGSGSGKSHHAGIEVIKECLQAPIRYLCVRKVYDTIKESQFRLLCEILNEAQIPYRATISPLKIYVGRSEILFKGLDRVEKLKSIHGLAGVWCEEPTEFDVGDFAELMRRVRPAGKVVRPILTLNPVSVYNWVFQMFFAPGAPLANDAFILKTTWRDNPFLPPDYGAKVAITKGDAAVYDRGEWGQPSGTVYAPFAITDVWPEAPEYAVAGLDFGFNNPCACVELRVKDRVFYARERLYLPGLDTPAIATHLSPFFGPKSEIYADPEDPKTISELQDRGFRYMMKAKKDVKAGIARVRQLQNAGRLFIHRDSPNLLAEAASYRFKTIRGLTDMNGEPLLAEEPEKEFDHLMDALRYAVYTFTEYHPKLLL